MEAASSEEWAEELSTSMTALSLVIILQELLISLMVGISH